MQGAYYLLSSHNTLRAKYLWLWSCLLIFWEGNLENIDQGDINWVIMVQNDGMIRCCCHCRSGLPPYRFDIKNAEKLSPTDTFVFEYGSGIVCISIWSTSIGHVTWYERWLPFWQLALCVDCSLTRFLDQGARMRHLYLTISNSLFISSLIDFVLESPQLDWSRRLGKQFQYRLNRSNFIFFTLIISTSNTLCTRFPFAC